MYILDMGDAPFNAETNLAKRNRGGQSMAEQDEVNNTGTISDMTVRPSFMYHYQTYTRFVQLSNLRQVKSF